MSSLEYVRRVLTEAESVVCLVDGARPSKQGVNCTTVI